MTNNKQLTVITQNFSSHQRHPKDQIPTGGAHILEYTQQHLDRSQILGLQTLIYLSLREQTSIAYQHKEMGFTDIPLELATATDALSEEEQLYLAAQIADEIFEDIAFTAASGKTNTQTATGS